MRKIVFFCCCAFALSSNAQIQTNAGVQYLQCMPKDMSTDFSDADGPQKTLRAFKRVQLKAGASQTVTIPLPREAFELWDAGSNAMRVRPGTYEVYVGTSSADKDLKKTTAVIR